MGACLVSMEEGTCCGRGASSWCRGGNTARDRQHIAWLVWLQVSFSLFGHQNLLLEARMQGCSVASFRYIDSGSRDRRASHDVRC